MHEKVPALRPLDGMALPSIQALDEAAAGLATASRSSGTQRVYAGAWRDFTGFCAGFGLEPLPASPLTVIRYLTHLAGLGRSVSTIDLRTAAIALAHRMAGHDSPTVREDVRQVLAGIRNTHGRPAAKKKALTVDLLAQVVRKARGQDLIAVRDRALILLCFGAALRRSELVALNVEDIERHRRGLLVRLRRSKTDQEGKGQTVAVLDGKLKIPAAVQAWLTASGITEGPVFRGCDRGKLSAERLTAGQFARILKARCAAAGLDPEAFGGHSPRRGFATSAGDEGSDLRLIATHMRHAKLETTAGYIEDADLFRKNAGSEFL
ncbi:MAG: site-specific integrase [Methylorubrum rhodinum]|uniref:site-specific integrase n=1 Tax=Methylorubrum rhodinum TaxID=29428 RepID=UPI003BAE546F